MWSLFESDPVWLWAIRPNSWASVYLSCHDRTVITTHHPDLADILNSKMVSIPSTFHGDYPDISPDVLFISGSLQFISNISLPPCGTHLFWLSHASRRFPTALSQISWSRICHNKVGGVTEARASFGINANLPAISLLPDLSRTLGHIVKHSVRPQACDINPIFDHYATSDLLSLSFPRKPILYPTHMSRSGWGMRELTTLELGSCFELPEYVIWEERFLRDIVPIQMFRSVIDAIVARFAVESPNVTPAVEVPATAFKRSKQCDSTWLPLINKWLPGSWSDSYIADKAVKSDDAPVDFKPWNRRIQLVLPCPVSVIHSLERFSARLWRANVCRSLCRYIRATYGEQWHLLSPSKRRIHSAESLSSSKRSRRSLSDSTVMLHQGGMCDGRSDLGDLGQDHVSFLNPNRASLLVDLSKGLRIVGQSMLSTWWEWSFGSSPFFWRWNGDEQISAARDGMQIFSLSPMPRSRRDFKPPRFDSDTRKVVASKIQSMIQKSYLEVGFVRSQLHYFAVPKGDSDVRVVFDGTSCGLNETLWSPNFFLPSSRNAADLLSFDSWMADADFAEFFHNFFADERIRKYAGVNTAALALFLPAPNSGDALTPQDLLKFSGLRWNRLFMGMKPSPYNAVRFYYWAEEFAKGNLRDTSNPFGFDNVILNLPGRDGYDTLKPKCVRWNSVTSFNAGDVITFVDDVRIVGSSKEHCHLVHRQFTSRMQYLGIQDAPRKFRPPSQDLAGAWTGTIFRVLKNEITKSVSQEKWDKGKVIVSDLSNLISIHPHDRPTLNRKLLERHTGFLNHLTMTFEDMTPFLKGFYLTLNSWRSKRDDHGWRMSDKSWINCLVAKFENGSLSEEEFEKAVNGQNDPGCPPTVIASTRLSDDVRALSSMFSSPSPPQVNLRSKKIINVIYGFGDASGTGLGATFTCGSGFTYRIGVWGPDESDQSSNWREFTNIVESLEEEAQIGNMENSEVFMFTDNSTVESCSVKGSSSSPKLLDLIIRLRSLTSSFGIKIHVFHVAGTRMIAQGTDGVSRGYLGEGIMAGQPMESFIPIHLSAIDRSPEVKDWIESWIPSKVISLSPQDWFDVGHDIDGWDMSWDGFMRPRLREGRVYLWTPPPFVADVAIAELRKARIKRQKSSHLFVVPKLCAPLWMKQVFKAADFVFEVPAGRGFWKNGMHEPLLIAIIFPFLRHKPWQLRSVPKMFQVGSQLRKLLQDEDVDPRDFLREFWDKCHRIRNMPENVVRKLLYFGKHS